MASRLGTTLSALLGIFRPQGPHGGQITITLDNRAARFIPIEPDGLVYVEPVASAPAPEVAIAEPLGDRARCEALSDVIRGDRCALRDGHSVRLHDFGGAA